MIMRRCWFWCSHSFSSGRTGTRRKSSFEERVRWELKYQVDFWMWHLFKVEKRILGNVESVICEYGLLVVTDAHTITSISDNDDENDGLFIAIPKHKSPLTRRNGWLEYIAFAPWHLCTYVVVYGVCKMSPPYLTSRSWMLFSSLRSKHQGRVMSLARIRGVCYYERLGQLCGHSLFPTGLGVPYVRQV